ARLRSQAIRPARRVLASLLPAGPGLRSLKRRGTLFRLSSKDLPHCTATKSSRPKVGETDASVRCMDSIRTKRGGSGMREAGRHRRWLFLLWGLAASCALGDVAMAQTNESGDLSF